MDIGWRKTEVVIRVRWHLPSSELSEFGLRGKQENHRISRMNLVTFYLAAIGRAMLEVPREMITGDRITITKDTVDKMVQFKIHSKGQKGPDVLIPGVRNEILKRRIGKPIKIVIHGYLETGETKTAKTLRNKFLELTDVTVITVDWGKGSVYPIYGKARANVYAVGEHLAKLVDWMVKEGANPANIHIIGHSLGAQVAGVAGSSVRNGRKVGRITGLDPALPGFKNSVHIRRLDKSDAAFVDVIHTSDNTYGDPGPLGHADFYVNGGRHKQPGCSAIDTGVCSHLRSVDYFAESIDPKHVFEVALCDGIPRDGPQGCKRSNFKMGNYLDTRAKGKFYVQTKDKEPFAEKILR